MKKRQHIVGLIIPIIITSMLLLACSNEEPAMPPVINIFLNDIDLTETSTVEVVHGERIEYRFEIMASATITDIKTVISDMTDPASAKRKEVLVAGLANDLNETVKGVLFPTHDMEVMLVVKDVNGNEVTKTLALLVHETE